MASGSSVSPSPYIDPQLLQIAHLRLSQDVSMAEDAHQRPGKQDEELGEPEEHKALFIYGSDDDEEQQHEEQETQTGATF